MALSFDRSRVKEVASRGLELLRRGGLVAVLLLALGELGMRLSTFYPVGKWLFWRYGLYAILCVYFSVACLVPGHAVVARVLRGTLPVREHLVTSFAVGVYVFFLAMFVGGVLGLYGGAFFVLMPAALVAAGAVPALRYGRRLVRHVAHARRRAAPPPWWTYALAALGLLAVALIYFSILTPENVAFDARWYHLGIAEHYAAEGAVRRFAEGWYPGTSPHLASFLYTWAFLLPGGALFDKVELSSHLELCGFLWTLAAIPSLVRLCVPGARARVGWAARFLFPGIFLYDSSLCTGADHVAAIFAIPIFTLLFRALRRLDARPAALLAVALAGAFQTKFTGAMILLAFPVLAVVVRGVWLGVASLVARRRGAAGPGPERWRWATGPGIAAAVGLVATSPYWLKNWIWYGAPFYPLFVRGFHPRPWTPDSPERWEFFKESQLWAPTRDWNGLKETLKALFHFSFIPNDWGKFHGTWPTFGSLFTLLLFALPFVKGARRTWLLFAGAHVGVFVWYSTHHQDRYLQAGVPWMVAGVVAVLILVWRSGWLPRVALFALVGLQAVWGSDVYFIPGHAMIKSPAKAVIELVSSGYRKDLKNRTRTFGTFAEVGAALPRGSKLLIHDYRPHTGIATPSVNDTAVNQGGISYGRLASSRAIFELLRGMGVTHMLWMNRHASGEDSVAGDLAFWRFAIRYGVEPRAYGSTTLAKMPSSAPPDDAGELVAMLPCGGAYKPGLYHLRDLNQQGKRRVGIPKPQRPLPDGRAVPADALAEVSAVFLDTKCHDALPGEVRGQFTHAAKRRNTTSEIWVRASAPEPTRVTPAGADDDIEDPTTMRPEDRP